MSICAFSLLSLSIRAENSHSIRLTPPLVISEAELQRVVNIIRESIEELDEVRSFRLLHAAFSEYRPA